MGSAKKIDYMSHFDIIAPPPLLSVVNIGLIIVLKSIVVGFCFLFGSYFLLLFQQFESIKRIPLARFLRFRKTKVRRDSNSTNMVNGRNVLFR